MREPRFLSAAEIADLLDLDAAAASQRSAFVALYRGEVDLPGKIMHPSRFDDSVVFAYAARLSATSGTVAKIGSVNPGNTPSVSALVVVLDPVTGVPVAVLDGTAVTTLRTAGGSAVAVDALAVADARELGVVGSGVQARAHVRAIARVRPLDRVLLWSPTVEHRRSAAAELSAELGISVSAVDSAVEAVADLPIVVTCTLSHSPVVLGSWLAAGATVVSIGSFEPGRCEVDAEVVRRARCVVVDDPATAVDHAGPIVAARLTADDLVPLGGVLAGVHKGRADADDIVFYNSVGLGVQDAAAAWAVIDRMRS
jgi:ornithine cyclodeaminase/alanine dehydrogenase-like protein (mu-crystallin family)